MKMADRALRLLALLWLAGCAFPGPSSQQRQAQTPVEKQPQAQETRAQQTQAEVAAEDVAQRELAQMVARRRDKTLTESRMLEVLERAASLKPPETRQRLEQLRSRPVELSAGERFELALLLSRDGMDERALKQSLQLLKQLASETGEASVRALLALQRRSLEREQRYRIERRKTAELEKKIEHLKGLERELDESNKRMEEPLTPKTEQAK